MRRGIWTRIGAGMLLGLAAVGCSGGDGKIVTQGDADTTEVGTTGVGTTTVDTGAPTGETGAATSAASAPATELGSVAIADLFLPDPAVGLAALTSYHQAMTLTVTGSGTDTVDSYARDAWPGTGSATVITATSAGATSELVVGSVGPTSFVRDGAEATCAVRWNEAATVSEPAFEPAQMLPPVITATPGGSADHDGVAADRYTFDAQIGDATGTGELLLAADTGVLVSYSLDLVDGAVTTSYSYEVTAMNALPAAALPAGCAAVLESVPAIDGATHVQRMPNVLDYATTAAVADVVAFYEQAMPPLGWTLDGTSSGDPARQTSIYANATTGESASILVESTDGVTWVNVLVRAAATPTSG